MTPTPTIADLIGWQQSPTKGYGFPPGICEAAIIPEELTRPNSFSYKALNWEGFECDNTSFYRCTVPALNWKYTIYHRLEDQTNWRLERELDGGDEGDYAARYWLNVDFQSLEEAQAFAMKLVVDELAPLFNP